MMGGSTSIHDLRSFRYLQENNGSLSDSRGKNSECPLGWTSNLSPHALASNHHAARSGTG